MVYSIWYIDIRILHKKPYRKLEVCLGSMPQGAGVEASLAAPELPLQIFSEVSFGTSRLGPAW